MQTSCIYFHLNILNTFYNLSVALGNGERNEANIFGEINLAQTIRLLCPSCIVSLTSSPLTISVFPRSGLQLFSDPEESYSQTGSREKENISKGAIRLHPEPAVSYIFRINHKVLPPLLSPHGEGEPGFFLPITYILQYLGTSLLWG